MRGEQREDKRENRGKMRGQQREDERENIGKMRGRPEGR